MHKIFEENRKQTINRAIFCKIFFSLSLHALKKLTKVIYIYIYIYNISSFILQITNPETLEF